MRASLLVAALLFAAPAGAAEPLFVLATPDGHESPVTAEDFAARPKHREHVTFLGQNGEESADYEGVSLWDMLDTDAMPQPGKQRVRLVARVIGRDGFVAAVAVAEIDPEFEGKDVLVGYALDGSGAAAGPLRMVVPGDKHGARAVKEIARIEVR